MHGLAEIKRLNAIAMEQTKTAVCACWWLIGRDQTEFPLAIAIDLHDADSELCNPGGHTFTAELCGADPEMFARVYASRFGVWDIHYDDDSTEFNADD